MKNEILTIIPARSGSKGVKNKNIKLINGKPLIYWTIKEAKKSKLSQIIVSTDSKNIKNFKKIWCRCSIFTSKKDIQRQHRDDRCIKTCIEFFL